MSIGHLKKRLNTVKAQIQPPAKSKDSCNFDLSKLTVEELRILEHVLSNGEEIPEDLMRRLEEVQM